MTSSGVFKISPNMTRTRILFDFDAYAVTSSKIESDKLLTGIHIPTPTSYPESGFPVIVKPSQGSGSHGICVVHDLKQLKSHLATAQEEQVIQKFVHGPSYSMEIIGYPGNYCPLQVTEIEVDPVFDCKRVLAPSGLSRKLIADFESIATTTAEALTLKGLMDIEVILDNDILRVLEIDARLPSQTPITVHGLHRCQHAPVAGGAALPGHTQWSGFLLPSGASCTSISRSRATH